MSSLPRCKQSSPETIPVDETMLRAARELTAVARACTEIQWIISSLLERAHHPDLPAELHMLQDIDRLQQTLNDIAALIEATAHPTKGICVPVSQLAMAMKLESLRSRLLGAETATTGQVSDVDDAEITWL